MPATTTTVKDQLNELTATVAQLTTSTNPADMLYLPEPDENDKDVHTEHCCNVHGCKYDEKNCPVSTRTLGQSYPCELCPSDDDVTDAIRTLRRALALETRFGTLPTGW